MAILVDRSSRVVTQGITGKTGKFHTANCLSYGYGRECFVGGVTPGKSGTHLGNIPIFDIGITPSVSYF